MKHLVFLLLYGSKIPKMNEHDNKEHDFRSQTLQIKDTVQPPQPQKYINKFQNISKPTACEESFVNTDVGKNCSNMSTEWEIKENQNKFYII